LKKLLVNIQKWFFLLLFLEFFGSITFFNHVHIVDGYAIVHSHPFKHGSNGVPVHSHPYGGFLVIDVLNHFIAVAAGIWFAAKLIPFLILCSGTIIPSSIIPESFGKVYNLRGPPLV
jgi:hypothetical protein